MDSYRTYDPPGPSHAWIAEAAWHPILEASLTGLQVLRDEDCDWYSHHHPRILLVLRARFDDPSATWFHIDLATGEILGRLNRSARAYRWVFNDLRSFDLQPLLRHRPA